MIESITKETEGSLQETKASSREAQSSAAEPTDPKGGDTSDKTDDSGSSEVASRQVSNNTYEEGHEIRQVPEVPTSHLEEDPNQELTNNEEDEEQGANEEGLRAENQGSGMSDAEVVIESEKSMNLKDRFDVVFEDTLGSLESEMDSTEQALLNQVEQAETEKAEEGGEEANAALGDSGKTATEAEAERIRKQQEAAAKVEAARQVEQDRAEEEALLAQQDHLRQIEEERLRMEREAAAKREAQAKREQAEKLLAEEALRQRLSEEKASAQVSSTISAMQSQLVETEESLKEQATSLQSELENSSQLHDELLAGQPEPSTSPITEAQDKHEVPPSPVHENPPSSSSELPNERDRAMPEDKGPIDKTYSSPPPQTSEDQPQSQLPTSRDTTPSREPNPPEVSPDPLAEFNSLFEEAMHEFDEDIAAVEGVIVNRVDEVEQIRLEQEAERKEQAEKAAADAEAERIRKEQEAAAEEEAVRQAELDKAEEEAFMAEQDRLRQVEEDRLRMEREAAAQREAEAKRDQAEKLLAEEAERQRQADLKLKLEQQAQLDSTIALMEGELQNTEEVLLSSVVDTEKTASQDLASTPPASPEIPSTSPDLQQQATLEPNSTEPEVHNGDSEPEPLPQDPIVPEKKPEEEKPIVSEVKTPSVIDPSAELEQVFKETMGGMEKDLIEADQAILQGTEEQERIRLEQEAERKEQAEKVAKDDEAERIRKEQEAAAEEEAAREAEQDKAEEEAFLVEQDRLRLIEEERLRMEREVAAQRKAEAKLLQDQLESSLEAAAEEKALKDAMNLAQASKESIQESLEDTLSQEELLPPNETEIIRIEDKVIGHVEDLQQPTPPTLPTTTELMIPTNEEQSQQPGSIFQDNSTSSELLEADGQLPPKEPEEDEGIGYTDPISNSSKEEVPEPLVPSDPSSLLDETESWKEDLLMDAEQALEDQIIEGSAMEESENTNKTIVVDSEVIAAPAGDEEVAAAGLNQSNSSIEAGNSSSELEEDFENIHNESVVENGTRGNSSEADPVSDIEANRTINNQSAPELLPEDPAGSQNSSANSSAPHENSDPSPINETSPAFEESNSSLAEAANLTADAQIQNSSGALEGESPELQQNSSSNTQSQANASSLSNESSTSASETPPETVAPENSTSPNETGISNQTNPSLPDPEAAASNLSSVASNSSSFEPSDNQTLNSTQNQSQADPNATVDGDQFNLSSEETQNVSLVPDIENNSRDGNASESNGSAPTNLSSPDNSSTPLLNTTDDGENKEVGNQTNGDRNATPVLEDEKDNETIPTGSEPGREENATSQFNSSEGNSTMNQSSGDLPSQGNLSLVNQSEILMNSTEQGSHASNLNTDLSNSSTSNSTGREEAPEPTEDSSPNSTTEGNASIEGPPSQNETNETTGEELQANSSQAIPSMSNTTKNSSEESSQNTTQAQEQEGFVQLEKNSTEVPPAEAHNTSSSNGTTAGGNNSGFAPNSSLSSNGSILNTSSSLEPNTSVEHLTDPGQELNSSTQGEEPAIEEDKLNQTDILPGNSSSSNSTKEEALNASQNQNSSLAHYQDELFENSTTSRENETSQGEELINANSSLDAPPNANASMSESNESSSNQTNQTGTIEMNPSEPADDLNSTSNSETEGNATSTNQTAQQQGNQTLPLQPSNSSPSSNSSTLNASDPTQIDPEFSNSSNASEQAPPLYDASEVKNQSQGNSSNSSSINSTSDHENQTEVSNSTILPASNSSTYVPEPEPDINEAAPEANSSLPAPVDLDQTSNSSQELDPSNTTSLPDDLATPALNRSNATAAPLNKSETVSDTSNNSSSLNRTQNSSSSSPPASNSSEEAPSAQNKTEESNLEGGNQTLDLPPSQNQSELDQEAPSLNNSNSSQELQPGTNLSSPSQNQSEKTINSSLPENTTTQTPDEPTNLTLPHDLNQSDSSDTPSNKSAEQQSNQTLPLQPSNSSPSSNSSSPNAFDLVSVNETSTESNATEAGPSNSTSNHSVSPLDKGENDTIASSANLTTPSNANSTMNSSEVSSSSADEEQGGSGELNSTEVQPAEAPGQNETAAAGGNSSASAFNSSLGLNGSDLNTSSSLEPNASAEHQEEQAQNKSSQSEEPTTEAGLNETADALNTGNSSSSNITQTEPVQEIQGKQTTERANSSLNETEKEEQTGNNSSLDAPPPTNASMSESHQSTSNQTQPNQTSNSSSIASISPNSTEKPLSEGNLTSTNETAEQQSNQTLPLQPSNSSPNSSSQNHSSDNSSEIIQPDKETNASNSAGQLSNSSNSSVEADSQIGLANQSQNHNGTGVEVTNKTASEGNTSLEEKANSSVSEEELEGEAGDLYTQPGDNETTVQEEPLANSSLSEPNEVNSSQNTTGQNRKEEIRPAGQEPEREERVPDTNTSTASNLTIALGNETLNETAEQHNNQTLPPQPTNFSPSSNISSPNSTTPSPPLSVDQEVNGTSSSEQEGQQESGSNLSHGNTSSLSSSSQNSTSIPENQTIAGNSTYLPPTNSSSDSPIGDQKPNETAPSANSSLPTLDQPVNSTSNDSMDASPLDDFDTPAVALNGSNATVTPLNQTETVSETPHNTSTLNSSLNTSSSFTSNSSEEEISHGQNLIEELGGENSTTNLTSSFEEEAPSQNGSSSQGNSSQELGANSSSTSENQTSDISNFSRPDNLTSEPLPEHTNSTLPHDLNESDSSATAPNEPAEQQSNQTLPLPLQPSNSSPSSNSSTLNASDPTQIDPAITSSNASEQTLSLDDASEVKNQSQGNQSNPSSTNSTSDHENQTEVSNSTILPASNSSMNASQIETKPNHTALNNSQSNTSLPLHSQNHTDSSSNLSTDTSSPDDHAIPEALNGSNGTAVPLNQTDTSQEVDKQASANSSQNSTSAFPPAANSSDLPPSDEDLVPPDSEVQLGIDNATKDLLQNQTNPEEEVYSNISEPVANASSIDSPEMNSSLPSGNQSQDAFNSSISENQTSEPEEILANETAEQQLPPQPANFSPSSNSSSPNTTTPSPPLSVDQEANGTGSSEQEGQQESGSNLSHGNSSSVNSSSDNITSSSENQTREENSTNLPASNSSSDAAGSEMKPNETSSSANSSLPPHDHSQNSTSNQSKETSSPGDLATPALNRSNTTGAPLNQTETVSEVPNSSASNSSENTTSSSPSPSNSSEEEISQGQNLTEEVGGENSTTNLTSSLEEEAPALNLSSSDGNSSQELGANSSLISEDQTSDISDSSHPENLTSEPLSEHTNLTQPHDLNHSESSSQPNQTAEQQGNQTLPLQPSNSSPSSNSSSPNASDPTQIDPEFSSSNASEQAPPLDDASEVKNQSQAYSSNSSSIHRTSDHENQTEVSNSTILPASNSSSNISQTETKPNHTTTDNSSNDTKLTHDSNSTLNLSKDASPPDGQATSSEALNGSNATAPPLNQTEFSSQEVDKQDAGSANSSQNSSSASPPASNSSDLPPPDQDLVLQDSEVPLGVGNTTSDLPQNQTNPEDEVHSNISEPAQNASSIDSPEMNFSLPSGNQSPDAINSSTSENSTQQPEETSATETVEQQGNQTLPPNSSSNSSSDIEEFNETRNSSSSDELDEKEPMNITSDGNSTSTPLVNVTQGAGENQTVANNSSPSPSGNASKGNSSSNVEEPGRASNETNEGETQANSSQTTPSFNSTTNSSDQSSSSMSADEEQVGSGEQNSTQEPPAEAHNTSASNGTAVGGNSSDFAPNSSLGSNGSILNTSSNLEPNASAEHQTDPEQAENTSSQIEPSFEVGSNQTTGALQPGNSSSNNFTEDEFNNATEDALNASVSLNSSLVGVEEELQVNSSIENTTSSEPAKEEQTGTNSSLHPPPPINASFSELNESSSNQTQPNSTGDTYENSSPSNSSNSIKKPLSEGILTSTNETAEQQDNQTLPLQPSNSSQSSTHTNSSNASASTEDQANHSLRNETGSEASNLSYPDGNTTSGDLANSSMPEAELEAGDPESPASENQTTAQEEPLANSTLQVVNSSSNATGQNTTEEVAPESEAPNPDTNTSSSSNLTIVDLGNGTAAINETSTNETSEQQGNQTLPLPASNSSPSLNSTASQNTSELSPSSEEQAENSTQVLHSYSSTAEDDLDKDEDDILSSLNYSSNATQNEARVNSSSAGGDGKNESDNQIGNQSLGEGEKWNSSDLKEGGNSSNISRNESQEENFIGGQNDSSSANLSISENLPEEKQSTNTSGNTTFPTNNSLPDEPSSQNSSANANQPTNDSLSEPLSPNSSENATMSTNDSTSSSGELTSNSTHDSTPEPTLPLNDTADESTALQSNFSEQETEPDSKPENTDKPTDQTKPTNHDSNQQNEKPSSTGSSSSSSTEASKPLPSQQSQSELSTSSSEEPRPSSTRPPYTPEPLVKLILPSRDYSVEPVPPQLKKPGSFPTEPPPVYMGEVEGEPESSPVLPSSAFESRGIKSCRFASNLKHNILSCQGGKLIIQDAIAAKSMVYYTLPPKYRPLEGEVFQMFSSPSSVVSFFQIGTKFFTLSSGAGEDLMNVREVVDIPSLEDPESVINFKLISPSLGYLKMIDLTTDQGTLMVFRIGSSQVAESIQTITLPHHYATWNAQRSFMTFDNFKIEESDAFLKIIYFDPAYRLRVLYVALQSEEELSNKELTFEAVLPPNTTIKGQPKLFDLYNDVLAVSYPEDSLILVMNLATYELIKVVYVNPNFFKEVGSDMLKVGKIQDSEPGQVANKDFKMVYSAREASNEEVVAVNEVHFYFNEGALMVFEFEKVLVDDTASDSAFNFLEKPYYFTSQGTSLVLAEEPGSTELKSFVQCRYDQFYQPPQVGRRQLRGLSRPKRRGLESFHPTEVIAGFTPASPVKCPDKHGTGNPYVTKFQATECAHCKDLYDYAIAKGEATGLPQTYDITVAKSLCSDAELGIVQPSSFSPILIIGSIVVGIIILSILISVVKKMKNRPKSTSATGQTTGQTVGKLEQQEPRTTTTGHGVETDNDLLRPSLNTEGSNNEAGNQRSQSQAQDTSSVDPRFSKLQPQNASPLYQGSHLNDFHSPASHVQPQAKLPNLQADNQMNSSRNLITVEEVSHPRQEPREQFEELKVEAVELQIIPKKKAPRWKGKTVLEPARTVFGGSSNSNGSFNEAGVTVGQGAPRDNLMATAKFQAEEELQLPTEELEMDFPDDCIHQPAQIFKSKAKPLDQVSVVDQDSEDEEEFDQVETEDVRMDPEPTPRLEDIESSRSDAINQMRQQQVVTFRPDDPLVTMRKRVHHSNTIAAGFGAAGEASRFKNSHRRTISGAQLAKLKKTATIFTERKEGNLVSDSSEDSASRVNISHLKLHDRSCYMNPDEESIDLDDSTLIRPAHHQTIIEQMTHQRMESLGQALRALDTDRFVSEERRGELGDSNLIDFPGGLPQNETLGGRLSLTKEEIIGEKAEKNESSRSSSSGRSEGSSSSSGGSSRSSESNSGSDSSRSQENLPQQSPTPPQPSNARLLKPTPQKPDHNCPEELKEEQPDPTCQEVISKTLEILPEMPEHMRQALQASQTSPPPGSLVPSNVISRVPNSDHRSPSSYSYYSESGEQESSESKGS